MKKEPTATYQVATREGQVLGSGLPYSEALSLLRTQPPLSAKMMRDKRQLPWYVLDESGSIIEGPIWNEDEAMERAKAYSDDNNRGAYIKQMRVQ